MEKESVFTTLFSVDCSNHTEKKNGLTYLSWAWAWAEVKKRYPLATYTIYESPEGWNYFTDGHTCWVKTGVTIDGLEHIEYLPVMDYRNASIPAEKVTSFDVNKAIQRSLTKAAARHGLGLYIYAGEDLPESAETQTQSVDIQDALDYIESCDSIDTLNQAWHYYAQWFAEDKTFRGAFVKRKKELTNGTGK